ncbi:MAG: FkbM family methyltransferase [Candidatus Aenigmatarchaeota archaeon]
MIDQLEKRKIHNEHNEKIQDLQRIDSNLSQIDHAKILWQFGDWIKLSKFDVDVDKIQNNKEKGIIALLVGVAKLQLGDEDEGKELVKLAKECGVDRNLISRVLISGLNLTLGRIHVAKNNDNLGIEYFREAIKIIFPHLDYKRLGDTLACLESIRMGLFPQSVKFLESQIKDYNNNRKERKARLKILETELELIKHEMSLAIQRQQLYHLNSKKENIHQIGSEEWKEQLKKKSVSQLGQDIWVLERTNYKRNGFFVDIGASDGVMLNNTWLLEKEFGWRGICVEPNPKFYAQLKKNRNCIVTDYYVGENTGEEIEFIMADVYSSGIKYAFNDFHFERRKAYVETGNVIKVVSISLNDLLERFNAPREIDYISIDTEGNEYDILKNFPFDKWNVKLFTIEHNYTEQRQKIYELLTKHGYTRIEREWEDWYEKL